MSSIKYQYVVSMSYDVGVYQTQVIDWLNLFHEHGLDFELVQLWVVKPFDFRRKSYYKKQESLIKNAYKGKIKFYKILPGWRNGLFRFINNVLCRYRTKGSLKLNDQLVIFSRSNIGYSIASLKRKYGNRIQFYWDLRAAGSEEILHKMKLEHRFSNKDFKILFANTRAYYICQNVADKIFAVSETLMNYYHKLFGTDMDKFVLYPCLSTIQKFYYDEEARTMIREQLGYKENDIVLVYSGGTDSTYCISNAFLALTDTWHKENNNIRLLIITKRKTAELIEAINDFPSIKDKVQVVESIPNNEMVKYLNAGDFGLLLRDNIVLNNVASPVKFAEYQLCGLPVIISEAVCDYAQYTEKHQTGYVLPNGKLENLDFKDLCFLDKNAFIRKHISSLAIENLSKESAINRIVEQLNPNC